MPKNDLSQKDPVVTLVKISNSCRQWKAITIAPVQPPQFPGLMCFASVNLGPNFLQGNQKRLNRIDTEGAAPSGVFWPANLVLTLPMIAGINGDVYPDRDFGLMIFSINPKRSIQDYHVLSSSEAK